MSKSTGVGRGHRPLAPRFWSKVEKTDGCWEWRSIKTNPSKGGPGGYGVIAINGKRTYAHRVSWEMHNGPIPDGLYVLHTCDNRGCVRPDHLFLGTYSDNSRDMFAKGRGNQRLNPDIVLSIRSARSSGVSVRALAEQYGVHRSVIQRIVSRDRWGWVAA